MLASKDRRTAHGMTNDVASAALGADENEEVFPIGWEMIAASIMALWDFLLTGPTGCPALQHRSAAP